MARVLVGCFGSAGDLFPLLSVADALNAEGHSVRFVVPRSLSLFLRGAGYPAYGFGRGRELGFTSDSRLLTTDRYGFSSWERLYLEYILNDLEDDLTVVDRVIAEWPPDLVVTGSFAVAVRIAAIRQGLRHKTISIYPQFWARPSTVDVNLSRLYTAVADAMVNNSSSVDPIEVVWGCDGDALLLHDPALLGSECRGLPRAIGYPSCRVAEGIGDISEFLEWRGRQDESFAVVSFGSFLGHGFQTLLTSLVRLLEGRGLGVAVIGSGVADLEIGDGSFRSSFLPHSAVLPGAACCVHHGGLGTTFAGLRAGVPAMIVPLAFDQLRNGYLLEASNAGLCARGRDAEELERVVAELLSDAGGRGVVDVRRKLIPTSAVLKDAVSELV